MMCSKRYEYGIRRHQDGTVTAIVREVDASGRGKGATRAVTSGSYEYAEAAAHRYITERGGVPPTSPVFTVSDCGASS